MVRMSLPAWSTMEPRIELSRPASPPDDPTSSVYQLQSQRTRGGGLDVSLATSAATGVRADLRLFRAAPDWVGVVVSDRGVAALEEDLKHIHRQWNGSSPHRRLAGWVARWRAVNPDACLLLVLWNRRSGRLSWHAAGLQAEPEAPVSWRMLLRQWMGRRADRVEAVSSGRSRLLPEDRWALMARHAGEPEWTMWLKIEAGP